MPHKTLLLTGATGNLGSRILVRFLDDPSISFKLLVFAQSVEEARDKVKESVEFWGAAWESAQSRIDVVLGDITKGDLGLAPQIRDTCTREVTHVIHCAANFKLNLPLEEARKSIVQGTENMVALADACRQHGQFRRFNYISTEEIGIALPGRIPEDFIPLRPQREYFNTYEFAKAETEEFLRKRYIQDRFPVTIYRPAIIVGDSKSGKIINPQGFYYIIRDMFLRPQTPFIPVNNVFQVNVVPIDALAEALYVMYDAPETEGRVYNLGCARNRFVSLRELLQSLQKLHRTLTGTTIGLKPILAPRLIYGVLLVASWCTWGKMRETLLFQLDFLRFFFVKGVFETTALDTFLATKGVSMPALPEYLPVLYQYYIEHDPALASLQK